MVFGIKTSKKRLICTEIIYAPCVLYSLSCSDLLLCGLFLVSTISTQRNPSDKTGIFPELFEIMTDSLIL